MKLHESIEINSPPEKVWPFLVEAEKIRAWYFPLLEFEFTSDHRGVGTTFSYVEKTPGGTMKINFAVTEWVENETMAFKMTSGEFLKGDDQSWTVERTDTGCRFIFQENAEFPYGVLGKVMGAFAQIGSKANVKEMLRKLKGLVESNPS